MSAPQKSSVVLNFRIESLKDRLRILQKPQDSSDAVWLQDIHDRLKRLRENEHEYKLAEPILDDALNIFEAINQICLPADYRAFIRVLGNGGVGPANGFTSLCLERMPFLQNDFSYNESNSLSENTDEIDQPVTGAIPICHLGCGHLIYLVVRGHAFGQLWEDCRISDGGFRPSQPPKTFRAWYSDWLANVEQAVKSRQSQPQIHRVMADNEHLRQYAEIRWSEELLLQAAVSSTEPAIEIVCKLAACHFVRAVQNLRSRQWKRLEHKIASTLKNRLGQLFDSGDYQSSKFICLDKVVRLFQSYRTAVIQEFKI